MPVDHTIFPTDSMQPIWKTSMMTRPNGHSPCQEQQSANPYYTQGKPGDGSTSIAMIGALYLMQTIRTALLQPAVQEIVRVTATRGPCWPLRGCPYLLDVE